MSSGNSSDPYAAIRALLLPSGYVPPQPQVTNSDLSDSDISTDEEDSDFDDFEDEDIDLESDDDDSNRGVGTAIRMLEYPSAPSSTLSLVVAAPRAVENSTLPSPTPTTLPLNPNPGPVSQPPSPPYLESQRLMDNFLAVAWLVIESYLVAYDEAYAPEERNWVINDSRNYRPQRSLLDHILRDLPAAFVPLCDFVDVYDIMFPDMTYPTPSMPLSFPLTSIDWTIPPGSLPPITPTLNAAPASTANKGPDWRAKAELHNIIQLIGQVPTNDAVIAIPRRRSALHPPGMVQPRAPRLRSVTRVMKPLPRRIRSAEASSQANIVGFVTQAAAGVGSVIASGIKRLRDEFDEGGGSKRMRIF